MKLSNDNSNNNSNDNSNSNGDYNMSAFMVTDETINTISFYTGVSAARLVRMNADAIMARYGSDEMRRVMTQRVITADVYQFAKCLSCYLYQCAEGNVPEQPLYKHLERVYEGLSVLKSHEAYDKCYWG